MRAGAFALGVLLTLATPGRAEPEQPSTVEVALELFPPDASLASTLEKHLRVELAARSIQVLTGSAGGTLARVRLVVTRTEDGLSSVTITITDVVTDKKVERVVDLTKSPPDARPLLVATTTDELLRASWSELTIPDAPPSRRPPPEVVRRTLPHPQPAHDLALGATGSVFGVWQSLGGELALEEWRAPRWAWRAMAGASFGLSRSATHGAVRADTLEAGVGGAFGLAPMTSAWGASVEVEARALRVSYDVTAAPGGVAASLNDWTVLLGGGLRGWATTGSVRFSIAAQLLGALRGVVATDAGQPVTGLQGVGGRFEAGAALRF